MPLEIDDLTTLDQTTVQTNRDTLAQLIQEAFATTSVNSGAFNDLVLRLSAILSTMDQTLVERAIASLSLLNITEDSTLADDDIVDAVLSNFRITRRDGTQATGNIQLVLTSQTSFAVPEGFEFEVNGVLFGATTAIVGRLTADAVIDETDQLIVSLGNDMWGITVPLTAVENGSAGNIAVGTQFTPVLPLDPSFEAAYAIATFTGGADDETNEELLTRLEAGAGKKAMSSRPTIEALLVEQFPDIRATSTIGFGDPEMFRDQHSLWPGSMGNRVDSYVRSAAAVAGVRLTVTATLVSKTLGVGRWQFSLSRDDAPGFYEVAKITQEGELDTDDGYDVFSDTRSIDMTGSGFLPDIDTALEGGYSRYQTSTILFDDTDVDATGLVVGTATRDYDIEISAMPDIGDIQDYANQRDIQWPGGDILIKAPVPVFTSLAITIQRLSTQPTIDQDAVKQAVASAVNATGFPGTLAAATVAAAVNPLLNGGLVTAIAMTGRLRQPDGTDIALSSSSALVVTDSPEDYVTSNTVCFFTTTDDITLTIVTV